MSEEEIIKEVNRAIYRLKEITDDEWFFEMDKQCLQAIQGLLDLYDKEREKNEKQQKEIEELKEENKQYKIQEDLTFKCLEKTKYMSNYISKDKIIKLLNKYDKESFIAKVDLQELLQKGE